MLVHNFKTLKPEDTRKALDAIDENLNECMQRGQGVDYMIRLSAEVYAELYFQGIIPSPERALDLYGQMEKITPNSPKPVLEIARLQLKAGHPEEFIKLMNEALKLKADYLPAYIELVNYYYKLKDIDSVWLLADQLNKVEFYSPQFVPFIQDLVIIANQNGDIRSKNIFHSVYEKFKYLIPPPLKIAK
jgi:tetratricopeptide (TPR) repeat protein